MSSSASGSTTVFAQPPNVKNFGLISQIFLDTFSEEWLGCHSKTT
jgi:hypothetical protein